MVNWSNYSKKAMHGLGQSKLNIKKYIAYLVLVTLFLGLFVFGILDSLDSKLQDRLYQSLGVVSPDIYVIGIDEETLKEYGPFQSWSRDVTANMIELLTENEETAPAVIGVDIGFFGKRTSEEDEHLVSVIKEAQKKGIKIVLSSFASFSTEAIDTDEGFYLQSKVRTYEKPFSPLSEMCTFGHANVFPDEDGIIRHSLHQFDYKNETGGDKENITSYSFAYEIYKAYYESEVIPPLKNNQWYIHYSGMPMEYYGSQGEGSSFVKVMTGEYPKEMFAGSVVMIGPYATGMQDAFFTPVSGKQQMNGVEISANVLQALMDENFKVPIFKTISFFVLIIFMAIECLVVRKLDFRISAIITLAISIAYIVGCKFVYGQGYIIGILYPLVAIWLIYLIHTFYSYIKERLEKKKLVNTFSKYLSPQIAKNIEIRGDNALLLGGQRKNIAILFVDIRSFTSISEALEPEQVVEFLNHYLNLTASSIFNNEGTLDKFIGDATMAVYNAPFDLDDYVFKAVKTGVDMVKAAKQLEKELTLNTGGKVGFGVGIHCGDAIVGNIGTDFRMEYTAIGDTINTAARLEGQAKAGEVIISDAVYETVKDRIDATDMGVRQLKGKAESFHIWRVDAIR